VTVMSNRLALEFEQRRNPHPRSTNERTAILDNPGFGTNFTDHMAVATWTLADGWHDSAVVPYGPFALDPATAVLHYAQEIFEGLKAYRHPDDSVWLFRADQNADGAVCLRSLWLGGLSYVPLSAPSTAAPGLSSEPSSPPPTNRCAMTSRSAAPSSMLRLRVRSRQVHSALG